MRLLTYFRILDISESDMFHVYFPFVSFPQIMPFSNGFILFIDTSLSLVHYRKYFRRLQSLYVFRRSRHIIITEEMATATPIYIITPIYN